ncbi:MAG: hypothetical protein OJF49_002564 [Ktedonobacterales bacterium]|jgi:hypothetical protein|nr:MAG: hypothetical protein OJF49_002564 [Ktedonobacterales bacterium]
MTNGTSGSIKIIGAGFGRTGTFSLKNALDDIGLGPCYHMSEVFGRPQDVDVWEAAEKGEAVDWHALLADYRAIVDWPGCAFYAELLRAYPDANVILTVRDPEQWYESVCATIRPASYSSGPEDEERSTPEDKRRGQMVRAIIWEGTFGGRFDDKAHAIAVYNQHIAEVKERVPAEKLLVYDVKQGWEPLCAFLGISVPATPFPYLNQRDEFIGRMLREKSQEP